MAILMGSNWPQAKFCLKSDSNHVLIDFFDPISAARFTRRHDSIWIRTIIISKNLIYIKKNQNRSNAIEFFNTNWLFQSFNWLFWSFYWIFWLFNWLFQSFNQLLRSVNWSFNQKISKLDWKQLNPSLDFE